MQPAPPPLCHNFSSLISPAMRVLVWIAGLAPLAVAVPSSSYRVVVAARADNTSASVAPSQNVSGAAPPELIVYTLPCEDGNSTARTAEIRLKQATLLYGPSLLGNASYFPGGPLGDAISLRDQTVWEGAAVVQSLRAFTDAAKVAANIKQVKLVSSPREPAKLSNMWRTFFGVLGPELTSRLHYRMVD